MRRGRWRSRVWRGRCQRRGSGSPRGLFGEHLQRANPRLQARRRIQSRSGGIRENAKAGRLLRPRAAARRPTVAAWRRQLPSRILVDFCGRTKYKEEEEEEEEEEKEETVEGRLSRRLW
ncbi:unnamed protein product [Prorocentrum cordatum]|uniref:Uncharacterized protein n=1 Tax=Prorocentrum cordatum TaxID=2364126 RepID=A0ABN9RKE1_9DINO|nr:unnamed protein product [Polarella glacialis]